MGYEIDFLKVGENSKGGDAIALRMGNLFGKRDEQYVIVVDGGYRENGEKLVEHIRTYYGTDKVDLVLCTHPDNDHIGGLEVVLEKLEVAQLAIHTPWVHSSKILEFMKDGRRTENGTQTYLSKALSSASNLVKKAEEFGIEVWEPFAGKTLPKMPPRCEVTVLGPSEDYYEKLVACFIEGTSQSMKEKVKAVVESLKGWLFEDMETETLSDPADDATTPMNNSSVILHLKVDDHVCILTGDAGAKALENAMNFAEEANLEYYQPNMIQIPHHGSKRNVGPTILDRILGERGQKQVRSAIVSAPKSGEPKHPAKKVINAFTRRGCKCISENSTVRHKHDAPKREGWSRITPLPFYDHVEE